MAVLPGLATAVYEISGLKVGDVVTQGRVQCKSKTHEALRPVGGWRSGPAGLEVGGKEISTSFWLGLLLRFVSFSFLVRN